MITPEEFRQHAATRRSTFLAKMAARGLTEPIALEAYWDIRDELDALPPAQGGLGQARGRRADSPGRPE